MTKYIIKEFFESIKEEDFEKDHWIILQQIKNKAKDTGNTEHLKLLFGKGSTEEEAKRNQKNREVAQKIISSEFMQRIVSSNSIKNPVNYIATSLCYMFRLNYS